MMATLRKRKSVENEILKKVDKARAEKEEVSEGKDMKARDPKTTIHDEELENKVTDSPSSWSFIDDLMQGEENPGMTGKHGVLASPQGACDAGDKQAKLCGKKAKDGAGFKMRLRVGQRKTREEKEGDQANINAAREVKVESIVPKKGKRGRPSKADKTGGGKFIIDEGTKARDTRIFSKGSKAKENLEKLCSTPNDSNLSKKSGQRLKKTGKGPRKTVVKYKKAEDSPKVSSDNVPEEVQRAKEFGKTSKKAWIEAMKAQGVAEKKAPKMTKNLKTESGIGSKAPAKGHLHLPPLPEEADLFVPQMKNKNMEQCCVELLLLLEDLEVGQSFSVQQLSLLLDGCDERRLLLICEVLEALAMVRKTGSDLEWVGREMVDEQLVRLHKEALEQGLLQQMRIGFVGGMEDDAAKIKMKLSTLQLAQKLVMIFLVVPEPRTLQLGLACKIIYAGSKQPVVAQAWLAEIATVLVSLGLLRKVYLVDKTNPKLKTSAYQFVGTTVEVVDVEVI